MGLLNIYFLCNCSLVKHEIGLKVFTRFCSFIKGFLQKDQGSRTWNFLKYFYCHFIFFKDLLNYKHEFFINILRTFCSGLFVIRNNFSRSFRTVEVNILQIFCKDFLSKKIVFEDLKNYFF